MNASKVLMYTNTWGYYINNSWNGMMGDIVHRDADLCGTKISKLHFVFTFCYTVTTYATKRDKTKSSSNPAISQVLLC